MSEATNKVSILIIDDDNASQSAMHQVLDSEGWRVSTVTLATQALQELATGDWKLVIANIAMTGLSGPLYSTLREVALAPALESGKMRLRVLFVVPELAAAQAQPVLESEHLPYALKPFHLHDFLEKVSDLLMETETISAPIRRVRWGELTNTVRRTDRRTAREAAPGQGAVRNTGMFANREDYSMTEEEITEYEKEEETQRKKKKKQTPGG